MKNPLEDNGSDVIYTQVTADQIPKIAGFVKRTF